MAGPGDITEILLEWGRGDASAADRLFPLVYGQLRRIARNQLRRRARNPTLDATELVHETYLKLVDQSRIAARDRGHFYAVAAKAMRHILVDRARRRNAAKRGGGNAPLSLADGDGAKLSAAVEILELDQALERLEMLDARLVELIELRFFGGLSVEETAEALGTSTRTVMRDWQKARAFLHRELETL